jgi:hypothetical protein
MLDLFQPPKIRPTGARRVTLVGTSEEARHRQRCEALIKARAAIRRPRKPRPAEAITASQQRRREKQAHYELVKYYLHHEENKIRARERMRALRAKRKAAQAGNG